MIKLVPFTIFLLASSLLPAFSQKGKNDLPPENKRLNILWITCEDMSPHLESYGDSTVKTPNISRLAREGVRYSHAYSTAGVCAPSRSVLITGMYQTTIGTHNMRTLQNLSREVPYYSAVLPPYVKTHSEYLRGCRILLYK